MPFPSQSWVERRLGQLELGVPGPHLGGLGPEQDAVERDRPVAVGDVESDMDTRVGGELDG